MKAYVGTFDAATATGNQTISGIVDESAASFTPKAVIIWTAGRTASGFGDGWTFQIGISDGTNTASAETSADDNVAAQRSRSLRSSSRIAELINPAGTVLRAGTLSSFGSGQFVINWATAPATSEKFHYLALGGSDLNVLHTINRMDQVRTASATVDDFVACISSGGYAALAGAIATMVGWFVLDDDGTVDQGVATPFIRDNVNPSQTKRYQRTSHNKAVFNGTGSGFVLDGLQDHIGLALAATVNDSNLFAHDLLLGGISAAAGSGLQPTSTGTQAISGLGFSPKCVIILSVGQTAQTTAQNEARFCMGAADRTRQGYQIAGSSNNVTPSVSVTKYDTSKVIAAISPNATAASSTTDAEASINSIDSDGFTLNWTTADATQREYLWIALGDLPTPSGQRSRTFIGTL